MTKYWMLRLTKAPIHGISLIIPATNKRDNIWEKWRQTYPMHVHVLVNMSHYLSSFPSRLHVFCSKKWRWSRGTLVILRHLRFELEFNEPRYAQAAFSKYQLHPFRIVFIETCSIFFIQTYGILYFFEYNKNKIFTISNWKYLFIFVNHLLHRIEFIC